MKKIFLFILLYSKLFSQSICTPVIPFQNTDLLQIYCATKSNSTSGCCTPTVSGNIGGYSSKPTVTISLSSVTDYTQGKNIGGVFYFQCLRINSGSGSLLDFSVFDLDNVKPSFTVDFWSAPPTGTFTNGANQVMSSYNNWLGTYNVNQSDYITTGSTARCSFTGINMTLLNTISNKNIYITVVSNGNYTISTNRLFFNFGVLQN